MTPAEVDAGVDGAADASTPCTMGSQCDDGVFCNGAEQCDPGATGADARGCVDGASACMPTQTCDEADDRCVTECPVERDADGDGVDAIACGGRDCDDADAAVHPGAAEICDVDDIDEDCDPTTFGIRDLDMDDEPDAACCNPSPSGGAPTCGTDCDDARAGVGPTATETCDGRDNDCDSNVDEEVLTTYFPDTDSDMYGDPMGTPMQACFQPSGYVEDDTDCDDTRSIVNPGASERCDPAMLDENCDGTSNPATLCDCTNGDAQPCTLGGACAAGTETCVDGAWGACSIAPVTESCNGIDDDCDGVADEMLTVACYADGDNDGYPNDMAPLANLCPDASRPSFGTCPTGTTHRAPTMANVDCDSADASRFPGSIEICNAIDDDCDGVSDEGVRVTCYTDGDNDGYATSAMVRMECPVASRTAVGGCPLGTTNALPGAGTTDCDDGTSSRRPGATEVCVTGTMAVDEDCDAMTDEGVAVACYADGDNDTYAASGTSASMQCRDAMRGSVGFCPISYTNRAPAGTTTIDCAPADGAIHPGAMENCDLGMVDEDCDGVGNPMSLCMCVNGTMQDCPLPGVCGDGTQTCSGGAWGACSIAPVSETCDLRDEDCDGTVDDGVSITCYLDADNDTYPAPGASAQQVCPVGGRAAVGGCPSSMTNRVPGAGATDCNDMAAAIRPGATETCTTGLNVDEDCDSMIDEGLRVACYADGDADTYAPSSSTMTSLCADPARPAVGNCPAGYTNRAPTGGNRDCNDASMSVHPGATELCDRVDSNCTGDAIAEDVDLDMHASPSAPCSGGYPKDDCDDSLGLGETTYPGAPEPCDRYDSDCSSGGGTATSEDADGDGHAPSDGSGMCGPGGYPEDDCVDSNALVYAGQTQYFTVGYCAAGPGTFCALANTTICGVCSPGFYDLASYDYDCSGAATRQPNAACSETLCAEGCYARPISSTDACGAPSSIRQCSCATAPRCDDAGSTAGYMPCR